MFLHIGCIAVARIIRAFALAVSLVDAVPRIPTVSQIPFIYFILRAKRTFPHSSTIIVSSFKSMHCVPTGIKSYFP